MIIKFNLLPKEKIEFEAPEKTPVFLKVYSAILLFFIISVISLTVNVQKKINSLETDKKNKETTLNNYKNIAKKVKTMEKENEEVKRRIETLVTLKESQGKNLRYLAEIISNTNQNQLMFSTLKLDDSKALIKGLGLDMDFLALYMQRLEQKKEIIRSVNLKNAQQKVLADLKLVEFELEVLF
jgi:type IV pilus assembly protein PilN